MRKSISCISRLIIGPLITSVIDRLFAVRSPFTVSAFKPTAHWMATDDDKTHTQMTEEAINRRVIHIEFSSSELPGGFSWYQR